MLISVTNCPRCSQDHADLEFSPLTHATDVWAWWAMCPVLGEPVLMKVDSDEALERKWGFIHGALPACMVVD